MTRILIVLSFFLALGACDSGDTNPFITNNTPEEEAAAAAEAEEAAGEAIEPGVVQLPGTVNPSANDQIFRREATTSENGNGYAENFSYDSATDTFTVDNLAFDGEGPYTAVRDGTGNRLGIGPFNVFENTATASDALTTASIGQLEYRALYGIGPDGDTSIAIVRTGGYIEYGFGGYIYQRDGSVVLPESGQAIYSGTDNYGGLRDFLGRGGLEYVNGDIEVRIDFNDFNEGAGVIGVVRNRRVFDMNGIDITSDILAGFGTGDTQLPIMRFVIQPDVLDSNGELAGTLESVNPASGDVYEEGNYYAVLSGPEARTITGIVVVTGEDPRDSDVTFRETAGFFAVR